MRNYFCSWPAMLCGIIIVAGCATVGSPVVSNSPDGVITLRVMTFNIEWGGTKISFDNVVAAIQLSHADIVAVQEAEGNLPRLANALGWHYDLRNDVVSRFPLIDPPGADGRYVFVEVQPGRIVAMSNVHLWSDPYGPDSIRDGATRVEVLDIEKDTRLNGIADYLAVLSPLIDSGMPTFLGGDFNAPSHADWTDAAVGLRPHVRYAMPWPVSTAMQHAGFRDSWHEVYPDPVENPGLTWWAARPPLEDYQPTVKDGQDRIDFVWFAGAIEVLRSEIVGEPAGPEVSFAVSPWPSDHRAVVSEFRVTPAELPGLVSTGRRVYESGVDVDVIYNAHANATIQVVNVSTDAPVFRQPVTPAYSGWQLPARLFVPGHYRVLMSSSNGSWSRDFWVHDKNSIPEIQLSAYSFAAGERIGVHWRNAPGNRHDYVAAFPASVATSYDNGLAWTYVGALPEGDNYIDQTTVTWGWPLAPGDYVIRLIRDDGYEVLAESAPFTVQSRVAVPANTTTMDDGRKSIEELLAAYQTLLDHGWQLDVVHYSRPPGTPAALPIVALRSPHSGEAAWILAGVHGEEPAGPNAIALAIDNIVALGERYPVVLMPMLNPQGYVRNWRYLNMPVYSALTEGKSVGDSSHLLPDENVPDHARAPVSSDEAEAITNYILQTSQTYPVRYSIDLHEDNLIDSGYVYSQGILGATDPMANEAVRILRQNNIDIKMSGQTRFDEDIVGGIVGPVTDSSIDELMSSRVVIVNGEMRAGPGAKTVLVFETPAAKLTLEQRVNAHTALIRRLSILIGH